MDAAFAGGAATEPVTLNGFTFVPGFANIVTGPMEAYVGHFAAAAMDWLIVTGALACGAALLNAGIRYWYALGREGILPRALGRTHPVHKTPHVAILVVMVLNTTLILTFWFLNRLPLEMYGWLAVQGVIWIVLVQALTALSTYFYFRKEHPTEMHSWKTVVAPWIGFLGQVYVLLLLYSNLYFLAAGAWYVNPVFEIPWIDVAYMSDELQFSWIGILGVLVPLAALALRLLPAEREPGEVRDPRPLHQPGSVILSGQMAETGTNDGEVPTGRLPVILSRPAWAT